MRVVIDTNAWLSRLLIADSVTAKAIDRALIECEILSSGNFNCRGFFTHILKL